MKESAPKLARIRNRSRIVCRGFFPAAVYALAAAVWAQPVAAQDRPVTLRLNTSIMWDSNVFRVPGSAPDPQLALGIPGKSDRITTTILGLKIDKAYAQQRFQFDVSETARRYANFTSLDSDAFEYHGAWLWSLSPRISGSLSADRVESLIPFTDVSSSQPNVTPSQPVMRVTNTRTFKLDGWMSGGWHVLAGAVNMESKTSQVFLAQPGFSTNTGELGLKYEAGSGNSITATTRFTRGKNPALGPDLVNLIDNEFRLQENELKTTWKISGKSTLSGRLSRIDRQNESLSQGDFSGTNGELNYIWAVDGRLLYNFSASRNILPWTADTQASYRIDDRFSFAPSLQISNSITMRLLAYRMVSDFLGPTGPLIGPPRRDSLRSAQLAVDWSPPMRYLRLTGFVQHDRRSSNAAGLDFDATIAMLTASLTF